MIGGEKQLSSKVGGASAETNSSQPLFEGIRLPVLQLPLSLVEPSYSHCLDSCLEESRGWGLLPEVLFANNLPEGLPLVQHLTPFFQWASPFPKSFEKVRR